MDRATPVKDDLTSLDDVRAVIEENLNKVESQIDSTVDSAKVAIHDIKEEARGTADRTLQYLKRFWERTQDQVETQAERHPWIFIGGMLALAYLLAHYQRSDRSYGPPPVTTQR